MKTLVVEDNFTSRMLPQKFLAPYGEVHIAVNGKEAVLAFRSARQGDEPYDLICLDIMMPEMDGHATLKKVRELEEAAGVLGLDGVKVVMTSALDDSQNVIEAFRSQCEGYLVKPVEKKALLDQLCKLGLLEEPQA